MPTSPPAVAWVVSADSSQREMLCGLVRKAGLTPLPFGSAEVALTALNPPLPPALIVTSLCMPGLDGWRFCRLLRAPEYRACNKVPIIIVAAAFSGDYAERIAAEVGADAFLPFPVDGTEFVARVQALLLGTKPHRQPAVLVVEEDPELADSLVDAFTAHGFRADKALTPREARSAFARNAYDLAVLDSHPPDRQGDALLDAFQVQGPNCVCVMIAADPTPELALNWLKRGAVAYLRKPVEPNYLVELYAQAHRERALLQAQDTLEAHTQRLEAMSKQAAAALQQSETRYKAFFAQGPDGVVILDTGSGKIIEFNDQVCRQLGYTREEFARLSVADIEASESTEEVARHIRKVQAEGVDHFDTRQRTKQGEIRDVHVTAQIVEAAQSSIYLCIWRDITKRKRAEKALREKDERLQQQNAALLTLVSCGTLFQADLQQAVAAITEACSALIGTERVSVWLYSEDYTLVRCLDLYRQSDREHTSGEVLRSAGFPSYTAGHRKGEAIAALDVFTDPRTREIPAAYYQEHDIRSLLDAPVWLHDRLGGILSFEHVGEQRVWTREDERLATDMAALLSLCFETNERKRTAQALVASEQSYRELFNASGDAFIVHDADTGEILDVNRTALEMFGFTRNEAIGSRIDAISERSPAYSLEAARRRIRAALVEGPQVFDWRFRRKEGRLFWAEVSLRSCTIGGQIRVLASMRDITERKRAEDALRESEQRFRSIITVSNTGAWEYHRTTGHLWCSPEYFTMLGLDPAEFAIPGRMTIELVWINLLHPDDREQVGRHFTEYLENGSVGMYENYFRMRHANGSWVWIWSRGQTLRNPDGTLTDTTLGTHIDITERKRAEDTLKEYQKRLADIIQFLPDATLAIDRDKRIIVWNKAIEEMTGIPASEMMGQGDYAYTIPFYGHRRPQLMDLVFEDSADIAARYPKITCQGDTLTSEFFCNALYSNHGAWIYAKAAPLYDASGKIIGAIESIRDITERKRAEEELARVTALLQAAIDQTPAGMLIADAPDVTIRLANSAALGIRGESAMLPTGIPAQLHPSHWLTFWPDGTPVAPEDLPLSRAILKGETVKNEELIIRRTDGEPRHVLANAAPVLNTKGEVVAGVVVFPDVTELRRSEEAARRTLARRQRESEAVIGVAASVNLTDGAVQELAAELTEAAARACEVERVGVWLFEANETRLVCVDNYSASTGEHSSGTVLFQPEFQHEFETLKATKYVDAHDALTDPRTAGYVESYFKPNRIASTLDAVIRSGGRNLGVLCFEHVHRTHHWEDDEITFACQLADQVALVVAHHERKQAEAEKEKLQVQLIQAQKMESVGRLAGGVAHDFNNMLQAILGNTSLALEILSPESPAQECLEEVQKCAQRSADLTRQLLTFARKQTIAPKILDLNEKVEGMLKMLRRLIGEDIDLTWRPAANLGLVNMDPSQVDQVLANLCVNARDAIGGVGKVTIATENIVCDDAYMAEHPEAQVGVYVRLAVSDNGCGLSPEVREHLFEPFFSTKGVGQGTGLGLATVYGIVKQNHGFINVYSEPGQGTTFQIHLPSHAAPTIAPTEKVPIPAPARGNETILLVEDEPSILRVSQRLLENLGYRVLSAGTPGEAIQLAREHGGAIHLLMTDVVMPEMNGRDLAKNLQNYSPNLKRLYMSGYTADVIAHHGVLDPGVHFIQKPFSTHALAEKVREALDA
jgi:PAS domain S-box-containing protein